MAAARLIPASRRTAGFTLVEVLISLAIVAIAVFPMLQIVQEAEKDSYDAKFATLCSGRIRSLLSELGRSQKPGTTGGGDLASMTEEEGYDDRFAYANIRYEWQVQSVDLSLDITPVDSQTDEEKQKNEDKKKNQEKADREEEADSAIDDRFRARYVRITFNYELESGEEKEIIVETYLPPLPSETKKDDGGARQDLVSPNTGK